MERLFKEAEKNRKLIISNKICLYYFYKENKERDK